MKNRDLSIFTNKKEFIDFTNKFGLNVSVKDGALYLMNEYVYIYIYMLLPFVYIPELIIYNRKGNTYSTINSLEFLREKDALLLYDEYDRIHNTFNVDKKNLNDINVERMFIININILSALFPEFFKGDFSKYISTFKPLRNFDVKIIKEFAI